MLLIRKNNRDEFKCLEIKELTIDGFTFRDLNVKGELDIYEDLRKPLKEEANGHYSSKAIQQK